MRLMLAIALVLGMIIACDDGPATSDIREITIQNATTEEVAIFINGAQSTLDASAEDTISLSGEDTYDILITGLETGRTLFNETLASGDIANRDGLIVVGAE